MNAQGKTAVVTGAGSGIGKATALALLKDGYRVALAGRREALLKEAAAESGADERALVVVTDVSDPASVRTLFDRVKQAFGRLDVLFNNAGVNKTGPIEELTFEQWKAVIDTNLTGAFLCTQAAFRLMKDQDPRGGRIINNGSLGAHVPRPNLAPYTAAKHGMLGLTKSTSLEGRKYDIACSQIDIGNARTTMGQKMEKGVMQANGTIGIEPVIDVEHVAKSVLHMANLPLDVNVQFLTIMATKMPYIGRG